MLSAQIFYIASGDVLYPDGAVMEEIELENAA
jgi:hypothetical protein